MREKKIYTGIGSRKTPPAVLDEMKQLAIDLAGNGFFLRSGGADGADSAFETGVLQVNRGAIQLYLPSPGFNGRSQGFHIIYKTALSMAGKYHPAWARCGEFERKLHARNAYQVLDIRLDSPSDFVVCWTPDGAQTHAERCRATGGTGTAISIAAEHGVPVFNLQRETARYALSVFLKSKYGLTIKLAGQQSLLFD